LLGPPKLKFKLADDATIDQDNKLIIPSAGLGPYYSFGKHVYLYCDAPPVTAVNNVKLYSSGTNTLGTGVDLMVGLQFPTKTNVLNTGYEVAEFLGGSTVTSAELAAWHGGITSTSSIFNYTAASPLSVSISEAGNLINAVGETTNYVLLQMDVANTAVAGTTTTETFYFSYDET
jgi:hypothetical protein